MVTSPGPDPDDKAARRHHRVWFLMLLLTASCVAVMVAAFVEMTRVVEVDIEKEAWRAGFVERDLPVPQRGPRDGHHRARLKPLQAHPRTGWHHAQQRLDDRLHVDERGAQRIEAGPEPRLTVLVTGSSAAFGAHASSTEHSWFNVMADELAARGVGVNVIVAAATSWKIVQEVAAIEEAVKHDDLDVVIMLTGLADLTEGRDAPSLAFTAENGLLPSEPGVHDGKFLERVAYFLPKLASAYTFASLHRARVVLVLQPALFEKEPRSEVEERLLAGSVLPGEALVRAYGAMRRGFAQMSVTTTATSIDLSRAFNGEHATTFVDLGHFSDPGHTIVGSAIGRELAPMLQKLRVEKNERATR